MENMILTPLQIWQDYDPEAAPLQISFTDFVKNGNKVSFKAFFNGDKFEDGAPRIFVSGTYPTSPSPKILMYIKDGMGNPPPVDFVNGFTDRGFGFVQFDYSADNPDATERSRYPESVKYGEIAKSKGHYCVAEPNAKGSCQYLWTTVTRRVITLIKTLSEDCKIILVGAREGADMMWQTAAMDKRVDAAIAINNAGWREYTDCFRFDGEADNIQMTDERERWFAGCASQTYARYVECPVLLVCGSNNPLTSIDRVESTLSLIDNDRVYCTVSPNTGLLLPQYALTTQLNFVDYFDAKAPRLKNSPVLSLSVEDDAAVANLTVDAPLAAKEICVWYSFDEPDNTIRNWNKIILPQNGCKRCEIPVSERAQSVFAFVNVEYDDGTVLSSFEDFLKVPADVKRVLTRKTHIIYERKNGTGTFVAENSNHYLSCTAPYLKAGAYDILGITCDDADITTYSVGEDKYLRTDESLLQFDAYSPTDATVEVRVCNKENGKKVLYTAVCNVNGDGEWTKCSLSPSSFKTQTLAPLKGWSNIKSLSFHKIKGVLFKNILWV